KSLCLCKVFSRGGEKVREKKGGIPRQCDQVERVLRGEPIKSQLHLFFFFFDLEDRHRARRVQHEHELLWHYVPRVYSLRRVQYQCEESVPWLFGSMGEDGVFDPLPCHIILQYEVLVWNYCFILETHESAVAGRPLQIDIVQNRFQSIDRYTRVKCDL